MAALAVSLSARSLHSQTLISPGRQAVVERYRIDGSVEAVATLPPVAPSLFVGPAQSNLRTFVSPSAIVVAPREPAFAPEARYAEPQPGQFPLFPLRLNGADLGARGALLGDSTRLNDKAGELFLPSAIPLEGDANFGTGFRTTMSGAKSSVGLGWLAELDNESPFVGGVRIDFNTLTTEDVSIAAPQAWISWRNILFGVADSLFTDVSCNPDTIEVNGPIGRPYLENGHAQFRAMLLQPDGYEIDPTGIYGSVSVEAPKVGVLAPENHNGFARYPDVVAALKYQQGRWLMHPCATSTEKPQIYDEDFHVQFATVVRDLGVENTTDTVRQNTTGWGLALSARCTLFRRQRDCGWISDYAFLSVTGGEGIGGYFTDLAKISNVNEAAFDIDADILEPLPLLAFFVGYQRQWSDLFHSTFVYSRIDLDSHEVPESNVIPYEQGQYVSANLMCNVSLCNKEKAKIHSFFAGAEYLFGDRVNARGDEGDAHRVMFVLAATN
jgi:hypothetical protein